MCYLSAIHEYVTLATHPVLSYSPGRSRSVLRKDRVLEALRSLCAQRPAQRGALRGINCCQICGTNLDNARSRRPGSVQPASVPSAFQQVISPGHVRESTRAGTCSRWTSDSPTTLTCMLICIRAWPASLGCPSTGFSPPTCSQRGRSAHSATQEPSSSAGESGALTVRSCQCHSR
jgi:hypothetical protein